MRSRGLKILTALIVLSTAGFWMALWSAHRAAETRWEELVTHWTSLREFFPTDPDPFDDEVLEESSFPEVRTSSPLGVVESVGRCWDIGDYYTHSTLLRLTLRRQLFAWEVHAEIVPCARSDQGRIERVQRHLAEVGLTVDVSAPRSQADLNRLAQAGGF